MSKGKGRLLNYFCAIVMGTLWVARKNIAFGKSLPNAILAP